MIVINGYDLKVVRNRNGVGAYRTFIALIAIVVLFTFALATFSVAIVVFRSITLATTQFTALCWISEVARFALFTPPSFSVSSEKLNEY